MEWKEGYNLDSCIIFSTCVWVGLFAVQVAGAEPGLGQIRLKGESLLKVVDLGQ